MQLHSVEKFQVSCTQLIAGIIIGAPYRLSLGRVAVFTAVQAAIIKNGIASVAATLAAAFAAALAVPLEAASAVAFFAATTAAAAAAAIAAAETTSCRRWIFSYRPSNLVWWVSF